MNIDDLICASLSHWGMNGAKTEVIRDETYLNPVIKIIQDEHIYILKGIPEHNPEEAIIGCVSAHKYLSGKGIAPRIIPLSDGRLYAHDSGYWLYLVEFIDGRQAKPTPEDEYTLGKLARQLHSITDYDHEAWFSEDKSCFYEWYDDKPFKAEFDKTLDELCDFSKLDRCFIHTDLGPHNAMIRQDGSAVFIDLDDAGIGSKWIDLGLTFITWFVEKDDKMNLWYRFDLATAFLRGYYGDNIPREEYDLIWQGAMFTHIKYMKVFTYASEDDLWRILKFGVAQKEKLWAQLKTA